MDLQINYKYMDSSTKTKTINTWNIIQHKPMKI